MIFGSAPTTERIQTILAMRLSMSMHGSKFFLGTNENIDKTNIYLFIQITASVQYFQWVVLQIG